MAGRINDDDIRALKDRINIVEVIQPYTALKGRGSNLMGLCPFHDEKSGSFSVNPSKGWYYCFGCQQSGDTITFVQEIEGLSFTDAVEKLARDFNITLRYEELKPGQREALGKRTRTMELLEAAHAFFREQLRSDGGAEARAYLQERDVPAGAWEVFGLGWAPDAWGDLSDHLKRQGYTDAELYTAEVASKGRRGPVDRFRGRIIFPIHDPLGRDVVAFGGRILPGGPTVTKIDDGKTPKYINSPGSPVYDKSSTLYGMHLARREIVKQAEAIIVEGYMDVIALHLAGRVNAVAPCGTALTEEHFRSLERMGSRVTLCLDGDQAGFEAAERARERSEAAGLKDLGVLPLPEGQDPADLVAEGGAAAFDQILGSRMSAVEFQITHLLRDADLSTPELQTAAYRATFDLLGRIDDPSLRYKYVFDVVAPAVRLPAQRIEDELNRTHPPGGAGRSGTPSRSARPPSPSAAAGSRDPQLLLERQILQIGLVRHDLLPDAWADIDPQDFTTDASRLLFTAIRRAGDDLQGVLDQMPDDDMRGRVSALVASEVTLEPTTQAVADLLDRLQARSARRHYEQARERLRDSALDATQRTEAMNDMQRWQARWRALEGRGAL